MRQAGPRDEPLLEVIATITREEAAPGIGGQLLALQVRAARRARGAEFSNALEQVVLYDGRAVGALLTARTDGILHLVDIALLPDRRGQGVGTAVLQHVLTVADREQRTVRALVYRTNPRAHALYRRLGFIDVAADEVMFTIERTPAGG